jgi:hypothetical protein
MAQTDRMWAIMSSVIQTILHSLGSCSRIAFQEYISTSLPEKYASVRFFSYGSNMNEGKFREDTRRNGHEFGLINPNEAILKGYKRMLGNRSKHHGLAFTICPAKKENVEGICHDVPIDGLTAFLGKEGILAKDPSYELVNVFVAGEKQPVLTLKGLKPSNVEKLDYSDMLKAFCYVSETIEGAKRWKVDYSDILETRTQLERELRKKRCKD